MTTIREAIQKAALTLSLNDEARLEAEVLLAHTLNVSRSFLYAHATDELPFASLNAFEKLIEARQKGYPIAYLVGSKEFWSLSLMVNETTLIPRPETELLVETILALILKKSCRILELGTGSGAIAIALAHMRPDWHITAIDYSQDALKTAQQNAKFHGLKNIDFLVSDWFGNVPDEQFDVIVSNPPYLKDEDPHLKKGDLRFEPRQALTSGADGLQALRTIIANASRYLKSDGLLILEHGYEQSADVSALLNQQHFQNVHSKTDIQGHARVILGYQ